MPDTQQLQWLRINDFSPGIRHKTLRVGHTSSPFPLGAADAAETYRCIALPGGGLGPLPRRSYSLTRAGLETNFQTRVQNGNHRIVGFHVTGPVTDSTGGGHSRIEFHLAYEYFHDADNNGSFETRKFRWERHRIWEASPTIDAIYTHSTTSEPSPANFYRIAHFADYRADPADPTLVGKPVVAMAWYSGNGGTADVWKTFPDPATPSSNTPDDISTTITAARIIEHQGRLVAFENDIHSHGTAGTWISDEQVWWTNVNLNTISNSVASMLSQGQMAGYGCAKTVSAQEMIAIKHRGGAISVHGDLDDPTIIALPGVMSTGGAECSPCYSPMGLIYGVRGSGVWGWQGGDASVNLSPTMEDDFWNYPVDSHRIANYSGDFELWGSYVVTPNQWLLDTTTGAWWRLEDGDTFSILHWGVNPDEGEWLYGAPAFFEDTATPVVYGWDRTDPAYSYRWRSQALEPTIDRVINVHEVVVSAIGNGDTVTITLTNDAGDSQVETFTIGSSTMPKKYRKQTRMVGSGIKVQIDADGGADAAPIVYEVALAYNENQMLANG